VLPGRHSKTRGPFKKGKSAGKNGIIRPRPW
jgi:hypothetical protein